MQISWPGDSSNSNVTFLTIPCCEQYLNNSLFGMYDVDFECLFAVVVTDLNPYIRYILPYSVLFHVTLFANVFSVRLLNPGPPALEARFVKTLASLASYTMHVAIWSS